MPRPKPPIRYCKMCGGPLVYRQKNYCSKACYGLASRTDRYTPRKRDQERAEKLVKKLSDAEQAQLNVHIDCRDNLTFESRIISAGHPDFVELCKQITPIHLVKRTERVIGILDQIDGVTL